MSGLRLIATGPDTAARLSWAPAAAHHARLHTILDTTALIQALAEIWRRQANDQAAHIATLDGQALPLPPHQRIAELPKAPGLNDPAKLHAAKEFPLYAQLPDREARTWAQGIGSDITYNADRGTVSLSSLYLLSRQRLDQQLRTLLDLADHAENLLDQAFHRWRRQPLQSGMNWDIRANRNAAESPSNTVE